MTVLCCLPELLCIDVLTVWCGDMRDVGKLDTAMCNRKARNIFLSQVSSPFFALKCPDDYFSDNFLAWLQKRKIHLVNLTLNWKTSAENTTFSEMKESLANVEVLCMNDSSQYAFPTRDINDLINYMPALTALRLADTNPDYIEEIGQRIDPKILSQLTELVASPDLDLSKMYLLVASHSKKLTKLHMPANGCISEDGVCDVVRNNKNLTHFFLKQPRHRPSPLIITDTLLNSISIHCVHMLDLRIGATPQFFSLPAITNIITRCTQLRSFLWETGGDEEGAEDTVQCWYTTNKAFDSVTGSAKKPTRCCRYKWIKFFGFNIATTAAEFVDFFTRSTGFHHIAFADIKCLNDDVMYTIARNNPKLCVFDLIDSGTSCTADSLREIITQANSTLTRFKLSVCHHLSNEGFCSLFAEQRNLTTFMCYCHFTITTETILMIIKQCPQLKEIWMYALKCVDIAAVTRFLKDHKRHVTVGASIKIEDEDDNEGDCSCNDH